MRGDRGGREGLKREREREREEERDRRKGRERKRERERKLCFRILETQCRVINMMSGLGFFRGSAPPPTWAGDD